jgi:heme/copper-type cytochrome/quinol oxidase subunit 4
MFVKVLKYIPRFIVSMLAAVILTLLAFGIAAASFLGLSLALQGWATHPPTTVNAPVQR